MDLNSIQNICIPLLFIFSLVTCVIALECNSTCQNKAMYNLSWVFIIINIIVFLSYISKKQKPHVNYWHAIATVWSVLVGSLAIDCVNTCEKSGDKSKQWISASLGLAGFTVAFGILNVFLVGYQMYKGKNKPLNGNSQNGTYDFKTWLEDQRERHKQTMMEQGKKNSDVLV